MDDGVTRALSGAIRHHRVDVDPAPNVNDGNDKQEEDRNGQREFRECLSARRSFHGWIVNFDVDVQVVGFGIPGHGKSARKQYVPLTSIVSPICA